MVMMTGETETEDYDEFDDESFDDEAEFDDEAAEFLPFLDPTAPIRAIGSLFQPSRRRALGPVRAPSAGGSVRTATLATPRGTATLSLPEPVVTERAFRSVTQQLQAAINRNTARLNTTHSELQQTKQQVGSVVANTQRQIAAVRKEQKATIARLRREQRAQATNAMFMSLIMQQQVQRTIEDHTHAANGTTETGDGDNTALMLLPMMMMGQGGGSGGDNGMMMMMMMMMMDRDK
jgi:hypothetical protein